jgi:GLPGLI family protein
LYYGALLTLINLNFGLINLSIDLTGILLNKKQIEMKHTIFLITGIAMGLGLVAQEKNESLIQGKIVYEDVMKLEIKLEGAAAQFADQLPKERRSKKELIFDSDVSIFKNLKEDESAEEVAMEHGGAMVAMKMMEPDNQLFYDIKGSSTIEKREFMTREFLIEGNIKQGEWKMTGDQKLILDYPCFKAEREEKDSTVTSAWFTPSIPVSTGPSKFIGLPGLVLQVELDGGDRTITAQSVELGEVDKSLLQKPKKGKKLSQEEFDQIVKEKMEEMGAEHGEGGATLMIRIEK